MLVVVSEIGKLELSTDWILADMVLVGLDEAVEDVGVLQHPQFGMEDVIQTHLHVGHGRKGVLLLEEVQVLLALALHLNELRVFRVEQNHGIHLVLVGEMDCVLQEEVEGWIDFVLLQR